MYKSTQFINKELAQSYNTVLQLQICMHVYNKSITRIQVLSYINR